MPSTAPLPRYSGHFYHGKFTIFTSCFKIQPYGIDRFSHSTPITTLGKFFLPEVTLPGYICMWYLVTSINYDHLRFSASQCFRMWSGVRWKKLGIWRKQHENVKNCKRQTLTHAIKIYLNELYNYVEIMRYMYLHKLKVANCWRGNAAFLSPTHTDRHGYKKGVKRSRSCVHRCPLCFWIDIRWLQWKEE